MFRRVFPYMNNGLICHGASPFGLMVHGATRPEGVSSQPAVVAAGRVFAYRDYSDEYVPQETAAREARKGIWAMRFVPPWEWRRGER